MYENKKWHSHRWLCGHSRWEWFDVGSSAANGPRTWRWPAERPGSHPGRRVRDSDRAYSGPRWSAPNRSAGPTWTFAPSCEGRIRPEQCSRARRALCLGRWSPRGPRLTGRRRGSRATVRSDRRRQCLILNKKKKHENSWCDCNAFYKSITQPINQSINRSNASVK